MTASTLQDVVRAAVRAKPDTVAYSTLERNWTFAQVDEESNRTAHGLRQLGVGPGERVACLTKYTVECVLLTLGACKIGAVCMPINWRLAPPEIEYIVNDGQAKFLMCDPAFLPAVAKASLPAGCTVIATQASDGATDFAQWRSAFGALGLDDKAKVNDTALQLYSSGTTGFPKGVELSHVNLCSLFPNNASEFRFSGERSVMFNALPTFHIAGIGLALFTLSVGGKTVFYPDFDPPRIISGIAEHGVTHMFMVPAMIQGLLNTPGVEEGDYRSLEMIAYGASPISEKVLVQALRVFGCGFLQVYGLTETSGAVTYLQPEEHDPDGPKTVLLRSAGRAGTGVQIRVVDPVSGTDLADNEVGEVWIHYIGNMRGYWRKPDATAAAFPHGRADGIGWFRSGDAGFMRDGYLFIHDRIKDMIVSGGENIYPAEVENAVMRHPAVADVAVIGVPDEKWGEAVKACVVLKSGQSPSADDIMAFCRNHIGGFKCPRSIDFRESLPRNPSGKLLKYQLRAPYWQGRERQVN